MTQIWKKGLFLRNTECGFCAIACFSETRDGRKSKNEESRKQKFKEDWGAELAGGNSKMEDSSCKIEDGVAALPPPLDCGVTSKCGVSQPTISRNYTFDFCEFLADKLLVGWMNDRRGQVPGRINRQ